MLQHSAPCQRHDQSEIGCETLGKGEVLERWEKPILAEAHYIEARYFNTFLLQDFHTKSHKSFHFNSSLCYSSVLLQEDWFERKMLLTSSAGFILFLLSHCTVSVSTKEAVVLANAHLLPQRGYEKLGNINEKGTHEESEWFGCMLCFTLLLCCNIFSQCIWKLALKKYFAIWTCPALKSRILKTLAQLPSNSREINRVFCKKILCGIWRFILRTIISRLHLTPQYLNPIGTYNWGIPLPI